MNIGRSYNLQTPLDPDYCGAISVLMPTNGINPGDIEGAKPAPDRNPTPKSPIKGPIERDPQNLNRYAYNLLSDAEKTVYTAVLSAVNNFETSVNPLPAAVNDTQIQKIVDYVQRDHPELFWFQHGATFYFDTKTRIVSRIELTYCLTKEEAAKRQEKIEVATKAFMTSITDMMSDYEATLHIYENIIKLVD